MKKLFKNDYKNAVIITSACLGAKIHNIEEKPDPAHTWYISLERQMVPSPQSHLPFNLLGEEGWRLVTKRLNFILHHLHQNDEI